MGFDAKLEELGLELPPAAKPVGAYKTVMTVGNMVYLSGHLPVAADGSLTKGRVETDDEVPAGYEAARQAGLMLLSTLREHLGSLDRVKRVVKILGMVASAPDFYGHPKVINGCSELFAEVFGEEAGVGTRSAFGVAALPLGVIVEIEAIFEIES